jgi:predicted DsbA family dithiol-disulfide isomerase
MTESSAAPGLAIDVFADVVCPWCYIGERRLERALAQRPAVQTVRRWRPFQLQPQMPAAGIPWADFMRSRFGGAERARPMFDRVASIAATVGLALDFDKVFNAPNTTDAHRVILFAAEHGPEWPLVDRIFRAHFAEGRDVGDRRTLAELAADVGLEAKEVGQYLASDRHRDSVRESQREAERLGVRGVPFFVVDGRYAVSGAQLEEVFLEAIDRATDEAPAARGAR